jgi:HD-like signal output (HDOD) protein
MSSSDDSGRVAAGRRQAATTQVGRSTATISIAQTAPIRIHHLTETLCADDLALRRSLPEAAQRALHLCGGASADAAAIEAALVPDPAQAGALISIAGAGLFAPRAQIVSVRAAVMHLGLESTRDALLMIVTNGIAANVPGFEAHAEAIRRRALASGLAARLIAKALQVESGHDFLVGLMHDVGELVLLQRAAEEDILPRGIFEDLTNAPLIVEALEADHSRVGAALCRAWGLPPAVAEAAEFHHDRRAGRRGRLPSQLAAAADVIALHVTGTPSPDLARQPIFAEVGLPPAAAATVITDVEAALPGFVKIG